MRHDRIYLTIYTHKHVGLVPMWGARRRYSKLNWVISSHPIRGVIGQDKFVSDYQIRLGLPAPGPLDAMRLSMRVPESSAAFNMRHVVSMCSQLYVQRHENVSILYADVVEFAKLTVTLPVNKLVETLNELFGRFDEASEVRSLAVIMLQPDECAEARRANSAGD